MANHYYKRMYSIGEFYHFLLALMRTVKYMKNAKKKGLMTNELVNHIMLAVTEVNGCELCSYKHTEDALKNGMSEEDIQSMLSGSFDHLSQDESVALFFAQHYAENKGLPTKGAWKRLTDTYGKEKALGILGATRAIMMGNTHGIAVGALKNRLQGKAIAKSNLGYELGISLAIIPLIPITFIHAFVSNLRKKPLIQYS